MKRNLLSLALTTAAVLALVGCSSFNMGAACYIPHGVTGQCSATTEEPADRAVPASATPQATSPSAAPATRP